MAKAKKLKAKAEKALKTGKLPKKVAGIELPKELRKQGGKLLEMARSPLVGDLLAAGLVALAANVRNQNRPKDENGAKKDRSGAAEALGQTAATLATVVAARAAEKITGKLTERAAPPAAPRAPDAPAPPTAPVPPEKPEPSAPLKTTGTRRSAAKPAPAPVKTPRAKAQPPLKAGATRKPATRKPRAKPAS
ncbi:hypothetical protein [Sphingomonas sp.]|uniref:hypothetical protein n=1 Tax=Sphingomonas sp. TaxID=28214 RepID=UPI001EC6A87D|nr:hypothetical protein [Sphingomonas sp.]MBX3595685.1 hypothetical protein [Sphingomonas sp.]